MVLHSLLPSRYTIQRYNNDPYLSMQKALQRTFDDVWSSLPHGVATEAASMTVHVDVKEDEKAFVVSADLPGLAENEVEVMFDDGILTIRGEKKVQRDEKKDTWHVVERSYGSFARQVALPTNIDHEKIEAKFDKGVLKVTLPKTEPEKSSAKKISVKAG